MEKKNISKAYPYIIAVLLFTIISFIYFSPILEGKRLISHDSTTYIAASQEMREYEEKTGEHQFWTNSLFGGMPTYQVSGYQGDGFVKYLHQLLNLFPRPAAFCFLYLLCGFLLLLSFRVNPWLSIAGSVLFAFASYNFIIIAAGHNSKALVIAYVMPLIGSVVLAYRGKLLLGGILTAIFLGLAIFGNHLQILYYTVFILGIFFVIELIYSITEKKITDFLKATGVLIIAALIGVGTNAAPLFATYEYSKYTMRGDSNGLTIDEGSSQDGLSFDYITDWSYGIDETLTLLIPNFKGGASGGRLSVDSHTAKVIGRSNDADYMEKAKFPLYWGSQDKGTSGPVYVGAIVCFLFIFGLIVVDGRYKWWLLAVTILSILLAWGRNFAPFTDFFINHVPMYNKFRVVTMTLVMAGVAMPLLGMLALKKVFDKEVPKEKLLRGVIISTVITGGTCLLFWLFPDINVNAFFQKNIFWWFIVFLVIGVGELLAFKKITLSADLEKIKPWLIIAPFAVAGICLVYGLLSGPAVDFKSVADADYDAVIQQALALDRQDLLSSDAFRSLIFILLTAAVLYFIIKEKLKPTYAIIALGLLFVFDLYPVAKRYLNDSNFVEKEQTAFGMIFKPTPANKYILQDKDIDFRVFDLSDGYPFVNAQTSYFHKSVGGYHAAKMRRYQELINLHLNREMSIFINDLSRIASPQDVIDGVPFRNVQVLNMLNTKYVITQSDQQPLLNPLRNGNAWFVEKIHTVNSADEEMIMLGKIDTKKEMIVNKSDKTVTPEQIKSVSFLTYVPLTPEQVKDGAKREFTAETAVTNTILPDSAASIQLISYEPMNMKYHFKSGTDQLTVFSEIFYDKGWNAYVNGEKVDYFRTNYLLRGMLLKAGEYDVEFRFEPSVIKTGDIIAIISSLLIIAMAGFLIWNNRKQKKEKESK